MWDLIMSVPDHCLSCYFMTSECIYTLILPFTSKTGQSVAQNRQKIF